MSDRTGSPDPNDRHTEQPRPDEAAGDPTPERFEQLLNQACEGELTKAKAAELEAILAQDESARRTYLAYLAIDASIRWDASVGAASEFPADSASAKNEKRRRSSKGPDSSLEHVAETSLSPSSFDDDSPEKTRLPGLTTWIISGAAAALAWFLVIQPLFFAGPARQEVQPDPTPQVEEIPIRDHSFEGQQLVETTQAGHLEVHFDNPAAWPGPGANPWQGEGYVIHYGDRGLLNVPPPDGVKVAVVDHALGLRQSLSARYETGALYELSIMAYAPGEEHKSSFHLRFEYADDVKPFVKGDPWPVAMHRSPVALPGGGWQRLSHAYTATKEDDGRRIGILISGGWFDAVRLTVKRQKGEG